MTTQEIFEHKKKAENFQGEGSAYVHTEMIGGKTPQTILCGDIMAMLFCIEAEINRISELTHTSFEQTLSIIAMNYKVGKDNVMELTKDFEKKNIKGSFQEMREEVEKDLKRKDAKLEENIASLRKKVHEAKIEYGTLKAKLEKTEKDAFSREQKLQKEIMKLEHENDDLRQKLMFGEGKVKE